MVIVVSLPNQWMNGYSNRFNASVEGCLLVSATEVCFMELLLGTIYIRYGSSNDEDPNRIIRYDTEITDEPGDDIVPC